MDLAELGWKTFFQQQVLNMDERLQPARIIAVQRSGLTLAPEANHLDLDGRD